VAKNFSFEKMPHFCGKKSLAFYFATEKMPHICGKINVAF
jgi:hypothetical protein